MQSSSRGGRGPHVELGESELPAEAQLLCEGIHKVGHVQACRQGCALRAAQHRWQGHPLQQALARLQARKLVSSMQLLLWPVVAWAFRRCRRGELGQLLSAVPCVSSSATVIAGAARRMAFFAHVQLGKERAQHIEEHAD